MNTARINWSRSLGKSGAACRRKCSAKEIGAEALVSCPSNSPPPEPFQTATESDPASGSAIELAGPAGAQSKALSISVPSLSARADVSVSNCSLAQSSSPSGADDSAGAPNSSSGTEASSSSSSGLRSTSSLMKADNSREGSCSSLIACSNCGVRTIDWPCRIINFADNAIRKQTHMRKRHCSCLSRGDGLRQGPASSDPQWSPRWLTRAFARRSQII